MYVVTVLFEVAPEHLQDFRSAIREQASNSLTREDACHQFDVCFDPEQPTRCFLFEKYADRNAFETHLASDHFQQFDVIVAPWIQSKQVHTWQQEQL